MSQQVVTLVFSNSSTGSGRSSLRPPTTNEFNRWKSHLSTIVDDVDGMLLGPSRTCADPTYPDGPYERHIQVQLPGSKIVALENKLKAAFLIGVWQTNGSTKERITREIMPFKTLRGNDARVK